MTSETLAHQEQLEELATRLVEVRRHLHENPELSHEEFETTAFIKAWLEEAGIRIAPYSLRTGLIAEVGGCARDLWSPSGRTLTRCRSGKRPAFLTRPRFRGKCTPAATIFTRRPFSERLICSSRGKRSFRAQSASCSSRPRRKRAALSK